MNTRNALRPLTGWGVVASVLIVAATAVSLAVVWSYWNAFFLAERFLDGDNTVSIDDLTAADDVTSKLNLGYIGTLVIAAAGFIPWLYRARLNSEELCSGTHRHGRGWVIGSWIVPIANLFIPFRVVSDVWRASDPRTPQLLADMRTTNMGMASSGLVSLWWAAWVTAFVLDRVAAKLIFDEARMTLDGVRLLAIVETVSLACVAVACVLIIMIIRQIGRWQSRS